MGFKKRSTGIYFCVSGFSSTNGYFLSYPFSFENLLRNSEEISIDDVKIKISSVKDLLEAKKLIIPLRDKDLIDIKELEKIYEQKNKSSE